MGIRDYAAAMQRRDERAVTLIGPYAVKTSGGLVIPSQHRVADGWIYAGRDAFCFMADNDSDLLTAEAPGRIDATTLVIAYQDCAEPAVTAPGTTPNAIVDFGGGREFVAPQGRLLEIVRMWFLWAASTLGLDEDWEARYLDLGAPLRRSGFGLSARAKNIVALVAGLIAAGFAIGRSFSTPNPSLVNAVVQAVGSLVVFGLLSRALLVAFPRWGRGSW